jgi:ferredoxin
MNERGEAPLPSNDSTPRCFTARLEPAGTDFTVSSDRPLLAAAEHAGVPIPSSCRNGTCRTCMCRLLEGQVRYQIQWPGLLPEEKAEGWILPCIAFPLSDVVLTRGRPAPGQ